MMKIGLKEGCFVLLAVLVARPTSVRDLAHHLAGHLFGDLRPDVDHLVVALAVGDQTFEVLVLDLRHFLLRLVQQLLLLGAGITMSLMAMEMPALVA